MSAALKLPEEDFDAEAYACAVIYGEPTPYPTDGFRVVRERRDVEQDTTTASDWEPHSRVIGQADYVEVFFPEPISLTKDVATTIHYVAVCMAGELEDGSYILRGEDQIIGVCGWDRRQYWELA